MLLFHLEVMTTLMGHMQSGLGRWRDSRTPFALIYAYTSPYNSATALVKGRTALAQNELHSAAAVKLESIP
ncbi:hypothetical protein SAMN04490220_0252 [Rhodococcus jostii]|uniref:Uncharacterized protein n=1 Tax=Rhodococcus jostii TaxID=132919 RepID=A0A1H4IMM1_RHOJO|nr:hypothetical protein SAMN04490220_0252 [Rhodococcus jostii]